MTVIKGMPVPAKKTGTWKRTYKYEYHILDLGDCFFIEDRKRGNSAAAAARKWGEKHGRKFTSRVENGGVYVCRVM